MPSVTEIDLGFRYRFEIGNAPVSVRIQAMNIADDRTWRVISSGEARMTDGRRYSLTRSRRISRTAAAQKQSACGVRTYAACTSGRRLRKLANRASRYHAYMRPSGCSGEGVSFRANSATGTPSGSGLHARISPSISRSTSRACASCRCCLPCDDDPAE